MLRLLGLLVFAPLVASAQSIDMKNMDAGSDSSTTIEVHKNKSGATKCEPVWEVHDGNSDIEGDTAAMNSEAKVNWKKSCDDWKKEFRQDNKDNKIINMSCGTPTCAGDAGSKVCSSKASYKVKTRLD